MENEGFQPVRSLVRAFEILDYISQSQQGAAFNQMIHDLKIPRSTLSGLLNTLLQYEYIQRTTDGRRFQLGSQILELSSRYAPNQDLLTLAKLASRELSQRTGEATQVMTLDKVEAVIEASHPSSHSMRVEFRPGECRPVHATASGKCLLAYQEDGYVDQHLAKELTQFTEKTFGTLEQLKRDLQITRDLGYAYDAEESEPGLHCIAIPICDPIGKPVASVSVSIPTARIPNIDILSVPNLARSIGEQYSRFAIQQRSWKPGAIRISWSMGSLRVQSYQVVYEAVQKYQDELGVDVIWNDAREDPVKQMVDVNQLIDLQPDVLILHAAHTHHAEELFSAAAEANIPTICFQRPVRSNQVEYFIGGDTYEMSCTIARFVARQLQSTGNIAILGGDPYNDNARNMSAGIYDVLQEYPQIEIVEDHPIRHWSRERAYELTKQICKDYHDNIDVIMAANDDMAFGVVKALRENNLDGKVIVTGSDGDFPCLKRLANGAQHATAFQDWAELARETLRFAVEIVGDRVDYDKLTRRSMLHAPPSQTSLVRDLPYVFVNHENLKQLEGFWQNAFSLLSHD